jgi:GR25 family glycosyltransferase involved in LPS biosynthesis
VRGRVGSRPAVYSLEPWWSWSTPQAYAGICLCSNCPTEVVVLENDAVLDRDFATDVRVLLGEVRSRIGEWDLLSLCFAVGKVGQARNARQQKGENIAKAQKSDFLSSAGYVMTHMAAEKLTQAHQSYKDVGEVFMREMKTTALKVVVPVDGRELVNVDSAKLDAYRRAQQAFHRRPNQPGRPSPASGPSGAARTAGKAKGGGLLPTPGAPKGGGLLPMPK